MARSAQKRKASKKSQKSNKKKYVSKIISEAKQLDKHITKVAVQNSIRHAIIPRQKRITLTYTDTTYLTMAEGIAYRRYRLNSIWDPLYETGGEKCNGWDEMNTLYDHYKVMGCVMDVDWISSNAAPPAMNGYTGSVVGLWNADPQILMTYGCGVVGRTSAYLTGISNTNLKQEVFEDNQLRVKTSQVDVSVPAHRSLAKQRIVYTPDTWFGKKDAQNMHKELTCLMAANPPVVVSEEDSELRSPAALGVIQVRKHPSAYAHSATDPTDANGTTAKIFIKVRLTYDVLFTLPDLTVGQV